jgi:hypothetical protein
LDQAREHYGDLLANYAGADADRPEIAEARTALAQMGDGPPIPAPRTTGPGPGGTVIIIAVGTVVVVGAIALAGVWLLWRRRSSPAGPASLPRAERRRRERSRK